MVNKVGKLTKVMRTQVIYFHFVEVISFNRLKTFFLKKKILNYYNELKPLSHLPCGPSLPRVSSALSAPSHSAIKGSSSAAISQRGGICICACASEEKQQGKAARATADNVGKQGVGRHRYLLGASAEHLQTATASLRLHACAQPQGRVLKKGWKPGSERLRWAVSTSSLRALL